MCRSFEVSQQTRSLSSGRSAVEINYEALGLSRFTTLGGDVFDRALTVFLKRRFRDATGFDIDSMPNVRERNKTISKLQEYAEAAKRKLTIEVNRLIAQRTLSPMDAMDASCADINIFRLV